MTLAAFYSPAQQPAALTLQTVAAVMVALYTNIKLCIHFKPTKYAMLHFSIITFPVFTKKKALLNHFHLR
jgi:hypothetical protein